MVLAVLHFDCLHCPPAVIAVVVVPGQPVVHLPVGLSAQLAVVAFDTPGSCW